ncbi:unnamed protein product [Onchocerca flexuosa]|uniref:FZ domain-containing protein n=1 Tax=Onchocerca flexuosa TaxID=387005 RepID=A0A183HY87_9BILA|nr:unnamed protein product [Onchocerca flexuosa]
MSAVLDLTTVEKDIVEKHHHQQIVIGETFCRSGRYSTDCRIGCTNGLVLSGLMALNELLLLFLPIGTYAYISESWAMLTSDRPSSPKCVDIPRNLTLCYGIQYSTMRLPNLLEHETVDEVIEQAAPWIPLHRLNCHPDTQLFLCSLFAPVCLATMDREILPCQSLCTAVQQGCENRMRQYGFPWPEMLSCNKYPKDNDMCIGAVSEKATSLFSLGYYYFYVVCRHLFREPFFRSVGRDTVIHFSANRGCPCHFSGTGDLRLLIMADQNDRGDFIANLILPWRNTDKPFKRAIRSFRKLNCQSLGREIRESAYRRSLHRKGH